MKNFTAAKVRQNINTAILRGFQLTPIFFQLTLNACNRLTPITLQAKKIFAFKLALNENTYITY